MSRAFNVEGVYAAMVTPFTENGRVSESCLQQFMEFYINKKISGIFPVSNVGEFASISYREKCDIISICTDMGKGKLKVCPGVSDLDMDQSIKLAEHARTCGADAVIISSPYYYPYPAAYVEHYVMEFLNRSPLPVIFYHSPLFANKISWELFMKILHHPNVIGLKESSGDIKFLVTIMNRLREDKLDIDVMLGWEELMFTGLVNGTAGSITSCGGIVPELLLAVHESFLQGNYKKAEEYQRAVGRIAGELSSYGFPQGYKMGMAARGFDFHLNRSVNMEQYEEELRKKIPDVKKRIDFELLKLQESQESLILT